MRGDWCEQLASLAALAPGWFERDDEGRWGVPPDEGALTTARRLLASVGDIPESCTLHCDADPITGDVSAQFWRDDGTLCVYMEAGLVCQMMAYQNPLPGFVIDQNETPFDEALAIVRGWLRDGEGE